MDINILITKTDGRKKSIPLTKKTTTLGRDADCDLRIPIDSCSRKHCQFTLQDNSLRIKDLGSSNGTFVNNQRINETRLNDGDKLTIGPVVLTVQIEDSIDGADLDEDPISALEAMSDNQEDID